MSPEDIEVGDYVKFKRDKKKGEKKLIIHSAIYILKIISELYKRLGY